MNNQLNIFMTVFSLFPYEEFMRVYMTVVGWQATTSIPWVLQSQIKV